MSQTEVLDRIVQEGKKWQGLKEIPGNLGWENEEFEKAMEQVGWYEGLAWCAFYTTMIYYKVFGKTQYGEHILENFTGSATETFKNCKNSPYFTTDVRNEVAGAAVIWRKWNNGVPDWRGHAGIIIEAGAGEIGSHFKTVEGNTDKEGIRTGGMVAFKTRQNNHSETDGLVVEGFIFPPIPLHKLELRNIEL